MPTDRSWSATSRRRRATRLPPRRAPRPAPTASASTPTRALRRQQRRHAVRRRDRAGPAAGTAGRIRSCSTCRRSPPSSSNGKPEPPAPRGRSAATLTITTGKPWPLGAHWRRRRRQLRGLLGPRAAQSSCACSTTADTRELARLAPARPQRRRLARPPRGRRARPGLRPARPRPVAARPRPPLQPVQAAARPLRARDRRPLRLARPAFRRRPRHTRGTWTCATTRANALKARVTRRAYDWGDDRHPHTPLADTVLYELHVKGFTKRNPAVPEALRGTYAGPGHDASIAHLQAARRHRGEPAAGAPARRRAASGDDGPDELLGLQHDRLLLPRAALRQRHDGAATRDEFRAMVRRAARRRHRGDPRRRLQPHRRGRRTRSDDQLARPRQRQLLPPAAGRPQRTTRTTPAAATRSTCATRACCRW